MTLAKSFLLGSAAALAAVVGASAADLPSKKAAPAQYVKICDAAGAGYFYIPGSDTCLKIGGYVELDWVYRQTKNTYSFSNQPGNSPTLSAAQRSNNSPSIDTEIQLEAVTKTSYGNLHTAIGFEASPGDGSPSGNSSNGAYLDYAYIEWAGLTAGKHESFYHNIGGLYSGYETPDYKTNLVAYTASFGGGFSATISLEDSNTASVQGFGPYIPKPFAGSANGVRAPDVILALRAKQGWGEVSLIGGFHQTNYNTGGLFSFLPASNKSYSGYGIMGYVSINLPMLAAGDTISFQAAYAKGASRFFGGLGGSYNGFQNTSGDIISVISFSGATTGYSLLGDFKHNWTPTVSTEIEGSYTNTKIPNLFAIGIQSLTYGYSQFAIGQVTKWTPVKGLEFGIDTAYYGTGYKVAGTQPVFAGAGNNSQENDFRVQFRAIRSF